MNNQRSEPAEVWLRGNVRPVTWAAALAAVVAGGLIAAASLRASSLPYFLLAVTPFCGVAAGFIGMLAAAASRPRLECTRDSLRVRLSPTHVETLPLDVVECFFLGSSPLTRGGAQTCEHHAAFRVNTLVLRLAERAEDYRRRTTFTPWGTWDDSYVIFDGRWCEPLSPELARKLGRRLVDAKRSAAAAGAEP